MLQLAFILQLFSSINVRSNELNLAHVFVDIIYLTCPFMLPPICCSYSNRNYKYVIIVRYKFSCVLEVFSVFKTSLLSPAGHC